MGHFQDHKQRVKDLEHKLEEKDQYLNLNHEVEYYEPGNHIDPIGEIDIVGILEGESGFSLDLFEIKTSNSNFCFEKGVKQLEREADFFDRPAFDYDEINTYLIMPKHIYNVKTEEQDQDYSRLV